MKELKPSSILCVTQQDVKDCLPDDFNEVITQTELHQIANGVQDLLFKELDGNEWFWNLFDDCVRISAFEILKNKLPKVQ